MITSTSLRHVDCRGSDLATKQRQQRMKFTSSEKVDLTSDHVKCKSCR